MGRPNLSLLKSPRLGARSVWIPPRRSRGSEITIRSADRRQKRPPSRIIIASKLQLVAPTTRWFTLCVVSQTPARTVALDARLDALAHWIAAQRNAATSRFTPALDELLEIVMCDKA
jgi:hypothetical protein